METANPGSTGASLETAIIFTNRMEMLAKFYQNAFGLGEFQRSPGHIGLQVGPVYLGFDEVQRKTEVGSVSLWFTVDDIQKTFDALVSQGAEIRYPPTLKQWGGHLAAVYDPDGNMIGLSQRGER